MPVRMLKTLTKLPHAANAFSMVSEIQTAAPAFVENFVAILLDRTNWACDFFSAFVSSAG